MFNFNINWTKLVKENIPFFLQQAFRLTWINVLIAPAKQLYIDFLATRDEFIYKVRFNGQVMYLERLLNDKFDVALRRIYINDGPVKNYFIYRRSEGKPSHYVYRRWNPTVNYATNEFAVRGNKVWKALSPNVNIDPTGNPTVWAYYKDVEFIWRKSEYAVSYNFIVYVPSSLSAQVPAIKGHVNYYKLGGRTYNVVLF